MGTWLGSGMSRTRYCARKGCLNRVLDLGILCGVHRNTIKEGDADVPQWTRQDEEKFQKMRAQREQVLADRKLNLCAAIEKAGVCDALAKLGVSYQGDYGPLIPPPSPRTRVAVVDALADALKDRADDVIAALQPYSATAGTYQFPEI